MAAPSFVQASTGATDATGTFTFTGVATGTIGDIVILQILNDGTGVINWGTLTNSNINKLDGTAGWDEIGIFFAGTAAQQRLFIGRRTSASSAPTFTAGSNTSGDDVYGRMYEFHDVSTGTTLATVIENAEALSYLEGATETAVYGATGTNEQIAQSFASPGAVTVARFGLRLVKHSLPTDNLVIELQSDSAGSPSGTVVATVATVASSSISVATTNYYFDCSVALSASTTYWLVVRRDGARSTTNYVACVGDVASVYADGASKVLNSGTWGAAAPDIGFSVTLTTSNGPLTSASTSATASDAAVTTLGPDRLALNFVAVNDDNAISAFTGETGGDWALAVSPYADSGGTDGAIGLQAAYPGATLSYISPFGGYLLWGGSGTEEQLAQSFTTGAAVTSTAIAVPLSKAGSPADNVILELQADSAGVPSGSALSTIATISASSIPAAGVWQRTSFSYSLSAATKYWIVARRSGGRDTSNYILWGVTNTGNPYTGGDKAQRDSGTWALNTDADLGFAVYTESDASGLTIDGGTGSIVDIDSWGVVGFALIGTTASTPTSLLLPNQSTRIIRRPYITR